MKNFGKLKGQTIDEEKRKMSSDESIIIYGGGGTVSDNDDDDIDDVAMENEEDGEERCRARSMHISSRDFAKRNEGAREVQQVNLKEYSENHQLEQNQI